MGSQARRSREEARAVGNLHKERFDVALEAAEKLGELAKVVALDEDAKDAARDNAHFAPLLDRADWKALTSNA